MATRKKRLSEVNEIPQEKPQEPVAYQDAFQEKANKQILELSKKTEGKGKTILYAIAAIVVVVILGGLIYSWSNRSSSAGQAALGNAIDTANAPVTTQPVPPEYTGKVFQTERARAEAAVAEFQNVANTYSGAIRDKALYFAAVNRLSIDRNAGIQELEGLAKTGGEVGSLVKFALAQAKQGDNKYDEAVKLYQELDASSDPVISKDTISFELASIYEKQDKKAEAADLYFKIADAASKAKDADGKPAQLTQTARDAKDRLQAIDPAKAAEIKEPISELPS